MKVDEIFGPTIQGEGAQAGAVTMFVRLGGCDYRCAWCDTMHAVDPANAGAWRDMTVEDIAAEVDRLAPPPPAEVWVTISGGNPAIWQSDLPKLVDSLRLGIGFRVNIETQGSVTNEAFRDADMVTVSPKGPSSGMVLDRAKLRDVLEMAGARAVLKFVIGSDDDFAFARGIAAEHASVPVYVQPLTVAGAFPGFRALCERVATTPECASWRVIPQLHVLAWGNERGR